MGAGFEAHAPLGCQSLKRRACPFLAQIAGNSGRQFFHRDGGSPEPEAWRRRKPAWHEKVRLDALDGGGLPDQRNSHIGQEVKCKAPNHAVNQWRQIEPEQCLRPQGADPEWSSSEKRRAPC